VKDQLVSCVDFNDKNKMPRSYASMTDFVLQRHGIAKYCLFRHFALYKG